MISKDQFYINSQIQEQIEKDPDTFMFNMSLTEGEHPYYDFASMELENFPKQLLMLNLMDKKQEFLIHSYYYLNNQERFYRKSDFPIHSISEIMFKDLLNIYHSYNILPITIDGEIFHSNI